ncbi:GxxExxY protein [Orenia metallireducens]|jgi:GxxExxY protein|uniref:GxxExxY protein n=1 Tax=Orenia metallireducens TaxID=1413210 RepID=A0A285FVN2_9FIRM|nr:GxxExxY protein [Orenia metallireducens]SNY15347.1 GxxExxY protein [Orenia metallireducens]
MGKVIYKELSYQIIGLAMKLHNKLGSGFLEKVYENSLMVLLEREGLEAKQQYPIKVNFSGEIVGDYIADILVEDKVMVELKIVDKVTEIHKAQVLNYLKATNMKLGIILNFKNKKLEYKRLVL